MKNLVWKVILPLSIISFLTITKNRAIQITDGPVVSAYGYPMVHTMQGFHTSMSLHYFIGPIIINAIIYFSFWFVIITLLKKNIGTFNIKKYIYIPLIVLSVLLASITVYVASFAEHIFTLKNDIPYEVTKTKFGFYSDIK